MRRIVGVMAVFSVVAAPALAQDGPSTPLSGVGVSPPKTCLQARDPPDLDAPAPKLVSTYPTEGQVIRPGLMILRLTFDLPMGCWPSGTRGARLESRPDPCILLRAKHWVLLKDRLDWTLLCHLTPKTRYSFRLTGFKGLSGREVEPFTVGFETSGEPPIATIEEAAAQQPWLPAGPAILKMLSAGLEPPPARLAGPGAAPPAPGP
jgi:hypothetical protein